MTAKHTAWAKMHRKQEVTPAQPGTSVGRLDLCKSSLLPEPLLFLLDESSLGMARIDEAIPWDACPYA